MELLISSSNDTMPLRMILMAFSLLIFMKKRLNLIFSTFLYFHHKTKIFLVVKALGDKLSKCRGSQVDLPSLSHSFKESAK